MTQTAYHRILKWFSGTGAGKPEGDELPFEALLADYASVKESAFNLPLHSTGNVDLNRFNPLSKVTAGNPWTVQYENQNRVSEIKLDVDRTFQEMEFFRRPEIQQSLINVLFVFGKARNLAYRQGMNELCAILFHVVHEGVEAMPQRPAHVALAELREAVTYALFTGLLTKVGLADFFFAQSVLNPPKSTDSRPGTSPLLERCDKIFDLLCQKDQRLHKHLVMNDISPNLFLVRWVRLWFVREFSFANTLRIWDFVFSHIDLGSRLDFPSVVDFLAVAMLINVRQSLLVSDNSGCFTLLLKYPQPADVGQLLDLTLQVKAGVPVHAPAQAPVVQSMPAVSQAATKRDRVLTDLAGVIHDLRNSDVSRSIQREIGKLEEIVKFLKP